MAGPEASLIWLRALPRHEALALLAGDGVPGPGVVWAGGYPMADTLSALAMLVEAHRLAAPAPAGSGGSFGLHSGTEDAQPRWWLHQIVVGRRVVGDIGFHGPPSYAGPAEVEIGYSVVPAMRGRGICTRACLLLIELAWRDGADLLRAETTPGNTASERVLHRAGFVRLDPGRYALTNPAAATVGTGRKGPGERRVQRVKDGCTG